MIVYVYIYDYLLTFSPFYCTSEKKGASNRLLWDLWFKYTHLCTVIEIKHQSCLSALRVVWVQTNLVFSPFSPSIIVFVHSQLHLSFPPILPLLCSPNHTLYYDPFCCFICMLICSFHPLLYFLRCLFILACHFSSFFSLKLHSIIPMFNHYLCVLPSFMLSAPSITCPPLSLSRSGSCPGGSPVAAPLPPSCCSGSATPGQCLSKLLLV